MSPDTALGQLAQRLSRLEQRVEDVIARFTERVGDMATEVRRQREDFDRDFRAFGPTVKTVNELEAEVRFVREQILAMRGDFARLDERMDMEREQRIAGQEERKREIRGVQDDAAQALRDAITDREKQNRELKNRVTLALLTLTGIFITSGASLAAVLLAGHG